MPIRDDRSYETLWVELLRRIPVRSPEWTDFNRSDPGITLVALFEFFGDVLWLLDERQRQRRRRRAAFLVVGAAAVGLAVWRTSKSGCRTL